MLRSIGRHTYRILGKDVPLSESTYVLCGYTVVQKESRFADNKRLWRYLTLHFSYLSSFLALTKLCD